MFWDTTPPLLAGERKEETERGRESGYEINRNGSRKRRRRGEEKRATVDVSRQMKVKRHSDSGENHLPGPGTDDRKRRRKNRE